MISRRVENSRFSMIIMPEDNRLIRSFLFALYSPYRRGFLEKKKVSRDQITEVALREINTNYPSEQNVESERIMAICSHFDCNVLIGERLYHPFSGISDSSIRVTDDYSLMIRPIKGIYTCVFGGIVF